MVTVFSFFSLSPPKGGEGEKKQDTVTTCFLKNRGVKKQKKNTVFFLKKNTKKNEKTPRSKSAGLSDNLRFIFGR